MSLFYVGRVSLGLKRKRIIVLLMLRGWRFNYECLNSMFPFIVDLFKMIAKATSPSPKNAHEKSAKLLVMHVGLNWQSKLKFY